MDNVLKQVKYSVQQALIPGNDWRTELHGLYNMVQQLDDKYVVLTKKEFSKLQGNKSGSTNSYPS